MYEFVNKVNYEHGEHRGYPEWKEKAIAGDPEAQNYIGIHYSEGRGTDGETMLLRSFSCVTRLYPPPLTHHHHHLFTAGSQLREGADLVPNLHVSKFHGPNLTRFNSAVFKISKV